MTVPIPQQEALSHGVKRFNAVKARGAHGVLRASTLPWPAVTAREGGWLAGLSEILSRHRQLADATILFQPKLEIRESRIKERDFRDRR
jgi:hypothetical protein